MSRTAGVRIDSDQFWSLRARAEINSHFGRAPGGQMRGAATKAMSDIVEERQQSRCPPAAAPLRAAARRPAGFVARSSHTAPGIARRSRLASGPGGQQQSVHIISLQTLSEQYCG